MKRIFSLTILVFWLASCGSNHLDVHQNKQNMSGDIWASISVNQPVFEEEGTKNLMIIFALVNDGHDTINPDIESSQIVVNGHSWEDSRLIFSNGPRDKRFWALPPNGYLLFGYQLGDRFDKPGIYTVIWKGVNFESQKISVRVVPKATNEGKPIIK